MENEAIANNIAVFHLVRKNNEFQMFEDFILSYLKHTGDIEHELIIIFKGFDDELDKVAYQQFLKKIPHLQYSVSDDGVDITAYIKATKNFAKDYKYFCFFNSHTVIRDNGWLQKLYSNLKLDGVGIVGSTGSWQSHRGSSNSYWIVFSAILFFLKTIFSFKDRAVKYDELYDLYYHLKFLLDIDGFPNVHIRTNGFMISSSLMLENSDHIIQSKYDAYKFESGKKGLSKSISRKNLKVLLVGRDGKGYEKEQWKTCNIYMSKQQENLLISDNMTRKYFNSDTKSKEHLRKVTWTAKNTFKYSYWQKIVNRRKFKQKVLNQKTELESVNNQLFSRLIIFGAGLLGQDFKTWIELHTKNIQLVGFVDSYVKESSFLGQSVFSPQYLVDNPGNYDYVLISSNDFYDEILNVLIELNIDRSIII
jgi:hypothetical protein